MSFADIVCWEFDRVVDIIRAYNWPSVKLTVSKEPEELALIVQSNGSMFKIDFAEIEPKYFQECNTWMEEESILLTSWQPLEETIFLLELQKSATGTA